MPQTFLFSDARAAKTGLPRIDAKQKETEEWKSAKAFEAVFLSHMVEEMMKTVKSTDSMGEHASEMWRSVISQSLANNLAEAGGLGIGDNVYQMLNAYKTGQNGDAS